MIKIEPMSTAPKDGSEFLAVLKPHWDLDDGEKLDIYDVMQECLFHHMGYFDEQKEPFRTDENEDDEFGMVNITNGYTGAVWGNREGQLFGNNNILGWVENPFIEVAEQRHVSQSDYHTGLNNPPLHNPPDSRDIKPATGGTET